MVILRICVDLWALGLGNVASSFFSTYVASGSFGKQVTSDSRDVPYLSCGLPWRLVPAS